MGVLKREISFRTSSVILLIFVGTLKHLGRKKLYLNSRIFTLLSVSKIYAEKIR